MKEAFRRWAASLPLSAGAAALRAAAGRAQGAPPDAAAAASDGRRRSRANPRARSARLRIVERLRGGRRERDRDAARAARVLTVRRPLRAARRRPAPARAGDAQPARAPRRSCSACVLVAALPGAGLAPPAGGATSATSSRPRAQMQQRLEHERRELEVELATLQRSAPRSRELRAPTARHGRARARARWSSSDDALPRGRRARMLAVAGAASPCCFALLLGRAVDLTVLRGPDFARRRRASTASEVALVPHRGEIVDRNGELLALSLERAVGLRASARSSAGSEARARRSSRRALAPAARARVQREGRRHAAVRLAQAAGAAARGRRPWSARAAAASARRRGAALLSRTARSRAHVLGFVGVDSQGLEGLERRFDREIRGESQCARRSTATRAAASSYAAACARRADAGQPRRAHARRRHPGDHRARAGGRRRRGARPPAARRSCSIRATGEVLALANVPDLQSRTIPATGGDPRWQRPHPQPRRHRSVRAGLDVQGDPRRRGARRAASSRRRRCSSARTARYQVGKWTIHDSHPHGWLIVRRGDPVLEQHRREQDRRAARARALLRSTCAPSASAQRTGIELPGESPGILRAGRDVGAHRPRDAQLRAGHLGDAAADGGRVRARSPTAARSCGPYVVRRIVEPDGDGASLEHQPHGRAAGGQPSARRSTTTELLRRVVEEKGGTGAQGARSTTSRLPARPERRRRWTPDTGGYSSKRIGSFVGFVPADAPRAVILVLIDEPGTSSYGGVVAAPVFRAIAERGAEALGVEPQRRRRRELARGAAPAADRRAGRGRVAVAWRRTLSRRDPGRRASSASRCAKRSRVPRRGWDVRGRGHRATCKQQTPPPGAPLAADRRLALRLVPGEGVRHRPECGSRRCV